MRGVEDYARAIELDSTVATYYNDRGWAYSELGQFENALTDLSRAVALDPAYARAFENRGTAYFRMKDWMHAVADYTAAIELTPTASLYDLHADSRLAAGDPVGADEDRKRGQQAAAPFPLGVPPLPVGVYRIGRGVSSPTLLSKVEPKYSERARQVGLEGTVVLYIVITSEGTPRDMSVVRSLGLGLDEAAMEAVSQWKFNPAVKDGKAVAVQATVEVNFRMLNAPAH